MTRGARRIQFVKGYLEAVGLTLEQLAPPTQNALEQWARAVLMVRENPSATWNAAVSELVRAAESEVAVLGESLGLEELAKPNALGPRAHSMKKLRKKTVVATPDGIRLDFVLDELPDLLLQLAGVRKRSWAVHGSKTVWNATTEDEEAARHLVIEKILPGIVRSRSPIRRVLLVCAGNTCRSPMAGGLLREAASTRAVPLEARTAGVCVATGSPVNPLAVSVLRSSGIDISSDHPEQLRDDLVEWAELIVPLSKSVRDEIVELFPAAELKIMPDVSEIPDPFGGVLADYEACRDRLMALIDRVLTEVIAGQVADSSSLPSTPCSHSTVTCINPYETIRKYECADCGCVMMCACDEAFARRYLPHQLSEGTYLETQARVAVTLGFVVNTCAACRGLPEPATPLAAIAGRTSKLRRYYWREISMRSTERFADWVEKQGIEYQPLLQLDATYRDDSERIESTVVEEIKAEHERSPKYIYEGRSTDDVVRANRVEVVRLDATYVSGATKGKSILFEGAITSVEDFAARSFHAQGYDALVAESAPFHVLFGCLLYRVICDPTDPLLQACSFGERSAFERGERGAMITEWHPADFGTPGYRDRRGLAVDAHLSKISESHESLSAEFETRLVESEPLRQYLWAHRSESIEKGRKLLRIIPADAMVRILSYLAADYWGHYVGWPDLVVHRPGEYFFAEVKGSGDTLSEEQKRWIEANSRELLLPFKLIKLHRSQTVHFTDDI